MPQASSAPDQAVITDHGRAVSSAGRYYQVYPDSTEMVAVIVREALQRHAAVRVRGAGHSHHGHSLPRRDETLLRCERLARFSFSAPGTVTVGAGASLWALDDVLRDYGYRLPVLNGGGPGPTVGGFIAAGGIDHASSGLFGGFWDNVRAVTLVDGRGEVLTVTPDDELYPWLFGSMGQLGVFTEATLDIVAVGDGAERANGTVSLESAAHDDSPYPLSVSGVIDGHLHAMRRRAEVVLEGEQVVVPTWFAVMVPPEEQQGANDLLVATSAAHPLLSQLYTLTYSVRARGTPVPLVFPGGGDFVSIELHGIMTVADGVGSAALDAFERSLHEAVVAAGWRRYIQVEHMAGSIDWRAYLGDGVYQQWCALKAQHDPGGVLNPGVLSCAGVGTTVSP